MMQQVKTLYDEGVATSEPADKGKQLFYSTRLNSPSDFIHIPYTYFSNPKLLQKPNAGQTGGMRIIPASHYAVQAASPVKEEALTFIAFLLSEEGQSLQEREGFALLKSINDKKLDDIQEQVKKGAYKLPNGKTAQVPDEAFQQFKQLLHSENQFAELDVKVLSIVGEEAYSFFSGQKSAEEIAKLMQNRVTTYLNE